MEDRLDIIGCTDRRDVCLLRGAFDRNHVRYNWYDSDPEYHAMTIAVVNGISLDFFGWNEPAVKFIVENFAYPITIEHKEL